MVKQPDPEAERKRAWLSRYRQSLAEQQYLACAIQEVRSRSLSISVTIAPGRTAPTGAHSDRVADSVQRLDALERQLRQEQQRGQAIAAEIITAAYKLPCKLAEVLCCQYLDGMSTTQTARKMGLSASAVSNRKRAALAALDVPPDTAENEKCGK